ncbi:tetratricopeptide repeat protein [Pseudodesulfovibrio tunisiensis]|uniref:tetratricopeptide repeat protein n=1 Tax=Pseudodesulfovibrio tunisiensis TaxID=463192 RepID=UPI001FB2AF6A|nr:tetratricopeptide repeat protein [Pseudodesulfovibrio tunisiensis]
MLPLNQNGESMIQGVFSIEKAMKIGAGTTARRVRQTMNYFVQELDDGFVEIQPLSSENMPVGAKERITRDELLKDYLPNPELYKEVMTRMREIRKAVARGDKFRKRGESFTAEFEYNKALALDEMNVRANFGVGMCYIQRGETEKAQEVFERIIRIDAAFEDEHKHLFNEYGIQLRKNGMFAEAADYYNRALELTRKDENLFYNLARARFEGEKYAEALEAVEQCLALAPGHEEGARLRNYIKKKNLA